VFIVANSDLYSIYQIRKELTWEVQKNDILTKLLPPLRRKINKKYKVTSADIVQMLQRRHRSQHHEYNIETKGEDFVKKKSRRATKNTAMSNVSSFFLIYKLTHISGIVNIYLYFNRKRREEGGLLTS
jgi:hypothetical protein